MNKIKDWYGEMQAMLFINRILTPDKRIWKRPKLNEITPTEKELKEFHVGMPKKWIPYWSESYDTQYNNGIMIQIGNKYFKKEIAK